MLTLNKNKGYKMSKTQLKEEDIEFISNLLAKREDDFKKIMDEKLDLYYDYYKATTKRFNITILVTGAIFVMCVGLTAMSLDILLALG